MNRLLKLMLRNLLSEQGKFVLHWVGGYILPVIRNIEFREQNILFLYKSEIMETEDKE